MNKLIRLTIFVVFFAASTTAQTSSEIRAKFGLPFREFFQINQNVSLETLYGTDKKLCLVVISEKYTFEKEAPIFVPDAQSSKNPKVSLSSVYQQISDSLSPELAFGKLLKDNGMMTGNCYSNGSSEYERAKVFSHDQVCSSETNVRSISIEWKRDECKKTRDLTR